MFAVGGVVLLIIAVWTVRKTRTVPRSTPFSREATMLLGQKAVQKDLTLTDDQLTKIKTYEEERRAAMEGLRDLPWEAREARFNEMAQAGEKFTIATLDGSQLDRLKQIHRQRRGSAAWTEAATMQALNMSMDQKRAAIAIEDDLYEQLGKIPRDAKPEERTKKAEALRKAADEQWLNVLSEEQKQAWKDLLGTPFKGDPGGPPGFGPGGRGGFGGPRGQAGGGGRGGRRRGGAATPPASAQAKN
jgi:hypothetical protein